jgi:trimethylamine:corrinoid methyltransferase-like protein
MTQQTYERVPALSKPEIMQIHDASVDILSRIGVAFNHNRRTAQGYPAGLRKFLQADSYLL